MNEYTFDASITVLAESQPAAADLILTHCITGADIAVSLFTEGTLNLNTGASCTQRNEILRLTRELDEAKVANERILRQGFAAVDEAEAEYRTLKAASEEHIKFLMGQFAELESRLAWHPIETAPKDGTAILAFRRDCGILLIRWDAPINFLTDNELRGLDEVEADTYGWFCADFVQGCRLETGETPTHWMPLPAAPNEAGKP